MNIELLEISKDNLMVSNETFSFSSALFLNLAKSEFSQIGVSKKMDVNLDGDIVNFKLCKLSPFIRESITRFLEVMLVDVSDECFENLGENPSKDEFLEYTYDVKELIRFIKALKKRKYNYLKRTG